MDILNWLYLKKQQLIKKEANNASTDIVALGAEVPFTTRGDGYQTYAMTLADAVASGCMENNTFKTGIYDMYPFPVTPSMLPTCTKIEDTPGFPTMFAANLVGYKVSGVYELDSANSTTIVEYLGTIETTDGSNLNMFPWKTSGTVTSSPNGPFPTPIVCAFANGATIEDDNGDAVPAELMTIAIDQYSFDGADLYLVAASSTAVDTILGDASFEYEFLTIEGTPIKFTIY